MRLHIGSLSRPQPGATRDVSHQNLLGILAMLGSMAAFVCNDVCVKLAASSLPLGEIICLRNVFASLVLFATMAFASDLAGGLEWPRRIPSRLMAVRVVGEIVSTILFLSALTSLPLGDVTAIAQVAPLAITAAAAILLNEAVGWRRWTATIVGFAGVALIVRPGSAAFSPAGAMVLAAVVFIVARDIATRMVPMDVSTGFVSLSSSLSGIVAGLLLWPFETWVLPDARGLLLTAVSGLFLAVGFALIVVALRTGDVGVVSPFRYTVIIFALFAGYIVWGETPDAAALLGTAIVCAAGVYTLHRERLRRAGVDKDRQDRFANSS